MLRQILNFILIRNKVRRYKPLYYVNISNSVVKRTLARLHIYIYIRSIRSLNYRILCQCKNKVTINKKYKICLNPTIICQTPSAFSFILFWFWSVRNHISIKCHLVLIQTEQSRHSGCTSWLSWPGPRVKTNPYKSPDVSNWIVINLINWTAFQSLLYCFNPSGLLQYR